MTAKQNAGPNGSSRFTPAAIRACSMEICSPGHRTCADFDWEEGFEAEEIGEPIPPVNPISRFHRLTHLALRSLGSSWRTLRLKANLIKKEELDKLFN